MGTTFVVSLALSVAQAGAQQSAINRRANAQAREAKRIARLKRAKVLREGRLRKAAIAGGAGRAGLGGSIVEQTLTAVETSTDVALANLQEAQESQLDQFSVARSGATTANVANLAQGLGAISSEFIGQQQTQTQLDEINKQLGIT